MLVFIKKLHNIVLKFIFTIISLYHHYFSFPVSETCIIFIQVKMKGGLGSLKKKYVFKNPYLSATHYDGSIIALSLRGGPACSQGTPFTVGAALRPCLLYTSDAADDWLVV